MDITYGFLMHGEIWTSKPNRKARPARKPMTTATQKKKGDKNFEEKTLASSKWSVSEILSAGKTSTDCLSVGSVVNVAFDSSSEGKVVVKLIWVADNVPSSMIGIFDSTNEAKLWINK